MRDPFKIQGPACVSFSGGRSSALMLRRCLDAGIDDDTHVIFANTGREREETLAFIEQISKTWDVKIAWVERGQTGGHRETDFAGAARDGEPFNALIRQKQYLPNPVTRFCTQDLKIRAMNDYMVSLGYEDWTDVIGYRADEPGRVAKLRSRDNDRDVQFPLFDAGISKEDVNAFWSAQPFDLQLRSWEGNCDMCFLKGKAKLVRIARDTPSLAKWWIDREAEPRGKNGESARFRYKAISYAEILDLSTRPMLPFDDADLDGPDDLGDCICAAD